MQLPAGDARPACVEQRAPAFPCAAQRDALWVGTNKGLLNGLDIAVIDLKNEQAREFYVELPIAISASGSYHDLGAFISGMAGLPRIVTLHDFNITSPGGNSNKLKMNITAKTYRYRDGS